MEELGNQDSGMGGQNESILFVLEKLIAPKEFGKL